MISLGLGSNLRAYFKGFLILGIILGEDDFSLELLPSISWFKEVLCFSICSLLNIKYLLILSLGELDYPRIKE